MQEGDIIIYRNNEAIATVPITPSATKEWKLMEKDCCTLVFNVTEPIYFQIGDYISYGGHKYYISEEPLPADYSNGVYKHTLQFDRDYMLWKNITFQMTHIKHVDGTDNYVRTRNEVSWSLTDVLEKHIQELIYNVEISGAKVDERYVAKCVSGPGGGVLRPVYRNHIAYCVDGRNLIVYDPTTEQFYEDEEALTEDFYFRGVETRKEMAFIQYNGTDLLSALKTICETYHCEWWVKTITPNPESQPSHPEPYFVLCLGKCEYGDYIDFKMTPEGTDYADLFDADNLDIQDADDSDIHTADINSAGADGVINVEKMSLARNTEEYANRLYVFGSTKNLPDTYRKKLGFEASFAFMDETSLYGNAIVMLAYYPVLIDGTRPSGMNIWMYQARIGSGSRQLHAGDIIRYTGGCDARFACIAIATESNPNQPYTVLLGGEGPEGNPTLKKDVEVVLPDGVSYVFIQNCLSQNTDGTFVVVSSSNEESAPLEIKRNSGINAIAFEDTNRKLSRSMIVSNNDFDAEKDSASFDISSSTATPNGYFRVNLNDLVVRTTGKYQISFPFSCFVTNQANYPYVYTPWDYAITIDGTQVFYYAPEQRTTLNGESLSIGGTAIFETELTAGTHSFILTYRFHLNESTAHRTIGATAQIDGSLSARYSGDINTTLTFDGNDYPIVLASWIDNWKGFAFSGSAPTGFGVGSKYSIAEVTDEADGLSPYKVPSNYYSYDNGSINSVYLSGERRLQLPITEDYPEGIPYIDPEETITAENLVEKVVIFDDIFPKCALRIVAIKEYVGNVEVETYSDGTSKYEETANYFIAVKLVTVEGDKDFPFKEDMRIDGTNLQIKFLTQDEEKKYTANGEVYGDTEHGYQLSGLTFDVAYVSFVADTDGARYKGFQIARNKDFGATFPNLNRKPTVGDTLVLSGWNVKAMQSLGLITQAENALKTAGYAYKEALKNDLFTFDCTIMSDWMQSRINNDWVGQKARVFHRSLKDKDNQTQTKESRVIGYQMKLDIPYDSPVLTIGETEAYSRLKALERALNGETRNASTGGAINASITPGGGGSGNAEWGAETESVINLKVGDVTKALVKNDALTSALETKANKNGSANEPFAAQEMNVGGVAIRRESDGSNYQATLPNKSGTLAMLSDISTADGGRYGKFEHVVVNKAIPTRPRKGMAYCFQDGLIKIRTGIFPTDLPVSDQTSKQRIATFISGETVTFLDVSWGNYYVGEGRIPSGYETRIPTIIYFGDNQDFSALIEQERWSDIANILDAGKIKLTKFINTATTSPNLGIITGKIFNIEDCRKYIPACGHGVPVSPPILADITVRKRTGHYRKPVNQRVDSSPVQAGVIKYTRKKRIEREQKNMSCDFYQWDGKNTGRYRVWSTRRGHKSEPVRFLCIGIVPMNRRSATKPIVKGAKFMII